MGKRASTEAVGGIDDEIGKLDPTRLRKLIRHLFGHVPDARQAALEWIKKRPEGTGRRTGVRAGVLDGELAGEYWNNARPIISRFNELGGGPEEEEQEAYEWLEKVEKLADEGHITADVRLGLIEDILEEYFEGNSGFDDALTGLAFSLCREPAEWHALVGMLREHPSDWNEKLIMDIERDHLKDGKAYLEHRTKNLRYGMDYWDLAGYYLGTDDTESALRTCEEGAVKGEGRIEELLVFLFEHYEKKRDPGQLERIAGVAISRGTDQRLVLDRLFEYYKALNDYENAKKAALRAYEHLRTGYFAEYKRLKAFLNCPDWEAVEGRVISDSRKNDLDGYLNICLSRGDKEAVLGTILKPPLDRWGWHLKCDYDGFARKISPDYPREMADYFWRRAGSSIGEKSRGSYRTAARYLSLVKDIYFNRLKDPMTWNRRFEALKEGLRNRPAFLEETRGL